MSSQICTEPSVTTPIQKPQIYILKQKKASQCYFVIYKQQATNRLSSNRDDDNGDSSNTNDNVDETKLILSYHKLFIAKDATVLIYDGDISNNKPLRALVGADIDWSFDSSMQSKHSIHEKKKYIYNIEHCRNDPTQCFIESNKVTAMDHVIANKFTFFINTTKLDPPYNILIRQNEFTIQLQKIKIVKNDNDVVVTSVIAAIGALLLFAISVYCFVYKKNVKFGSVVNPSNQRNNGVNRNLDADDEEENDELTPKADKKLIRLATVQYRYKRKVFESILLEDDDRCCPICILDFEENDNITMLPCSHLFHSKCVTTWLNEHQACCPMCKKDIVITALQIKQNDNNNNTIVSNNQIDQKVIERYKKREFAFQSTTIKVSRKKKKRGQRQKKIIAKNNDDGVVVKSYDNVSSVI